MKANVYMHTHVLWWHLIFTTLYDVVTIIIPMLRNEETEKQKIQVTCLESVN